jgi:hypothetical protein
MLEVTVANGNAYGRPCWPRLVGNCVDCVTTRAKSGRRLSWTISSQSGTAGPSWIPTIYSPFAVGVMI